MKKQRLINVTTPNGVIEPWTGLKKMCNAYGFSYGTLSKKLNRRRPLEELQLNEKGLIEFTYQGFKINEVFTNCGGSKEV